LHAIFLQSFFTAKLLPSDFFQIIVFFSNDVILSLHLPNADELLRIRCR